MTDLPPILTDLTLAPFLGVKPRAVADLCRRGRLPSCKVGRRWIVQRAAFLAFLERQERAHRAPTPEEADPSRLLRALPPPRRGRRVTNAGGRGPLAT